MLVQVHPNMPHIPLHLPVPPKTAPKPGNVHLHPKTLPRLDILHNPVPARQQRPQFVTAKNKIQTKTKWRPTNRLYNNIITNKYIELTEKYKWSTWYYTIGDINVEDWVSDFWENVCRVSGEYILGHGVCWVYDGGGFCGGVYWGLFVSAGCRDAGQDE